MPVEGMRAVLPDVSDRVRFWGRTYVGRGDLDAALDAITVACRSAGLFDQERREIGDGVVEIEAVQTAPWREVCRKRLLQRVTWRVESRDGVLSVSSDFRMFRRYAWRTVLLALSIGMAFASTVLLDALVFTGTRKWLQGLDLVLIAPASVVAIRLVDRFGILGRRTDSVWRRVLKTLENAGAVLEPMGLDGGRRYISSIMAYFIYFSAVGVGWLVFQVKLTPRLRAPEMRELIFFSLIIPAILLLVISLGLMSRYRGLGERIASILVGLLTSLAAVSLLASQLPWWLLSTAIEAFARPVHHQQTRMLSWFFIFTTSFLGMWGLSLSGFAVAASRPSYEELRWHGEHPAWKTWRAAIGDARIVRLFRWVFLPLWSLFGLLITAGLALAVFTMSSALSPQESALGDSAIGATRWVLASASGDSLQARWIGVLARGAWCLYGALVLTLFALSTGQLWYARRRTRRRLRAARPDSTTGAGRRLVEVHRELSRVAGVPRVRLAVRDYPSIAAWSSAFGVLGHERYVEVTTGALEALDRDELSALVAHELAHHRHGRPRLDILFRWLGRVTFTGDGFSRAVQHSFGYEQEADRTALKLLDELGIGAPALGNTLRKMRHTNSLFAAPGGNEGSGVPAVADPTPARAEVGAESSGPSDVAETWRSRWGQRLRLFVEQYVSGLDLHYWHPSYEERLAALEAAARPARTPDGPVITTWDL